MNMDAYRVFINDGKDGMKDVADLEDIGSLLYAHLVKREQDAVTIRVVALKRDGKRIDEIGTWGE